MQSILLYCFGNRLFIYLFLFVYYINYFFFPVYVFFPSFQTGNGLMALYALGMGVSSDEYYVYHFV